MKPGLGFFFFEIRLLAFGYEFGDLLSQVLDLCLHFQHLFLAGFCFEKGLFLTKFLVFKGGFSLLLDSFQGVFLFHKDKSHPIYILIDLFALFPGFFDVLIVGIDTLNSIQDFSSLRRSDSCDVDDVTLLDHVVAIHIDASFSKHPLEFSVGGRFLVEIVVDIIARLGMRVELYLFCEYDFSRIHRDFPVLVVKGECDQA